MQPFAIAPSILSADFARLGEEVDKVLAAGADIVHFDVMDNHYVPNLTIGPMVCSALRKYGITAPIDAHLMVSPVDRIIGDFIDAGATYVTFHPEATLHIDRSLQLIRDGGAKSGLVFNPATSLDCLKYVMDKVDMILLMSVSSLYAIWAAFTLRSAAERARKQVLGRLRDRYLTCVSGGKDSQRASALKELIEEVTSVRSGAFAPISQHPVLGALLLPSGGLGVWALVESEDGE